MKIGAIDVGTNSCRMLLVDNTAGEYRELERDLQTTRLGEGVAASGLLKEEAVERTLQAVKDFLKRMEGAGAARIKIIGTSALRDVSNSNCFLDRLKDETGYHLEIVSGLDEARLIFAGVSLDLPRKDFLIIDIGGGSTEFVWEKDGKTRFQSINLGAVRMTEQYIPHPEEEITGEDLERLLDRVGEIIEGELKERAFQGQNLSVVGVGGTITTLAAIDLGLEEYDREQVHLYRLTRQRIETLLARLSDMSLQQRKQLPGLQAERADIIVSGIAILKAIMTRYSLPEIIVSDRGILYGIIKKAEK